MSEVPSFTQSVGFLKENLIEDLADLIDREELKERWIEEGSCPLGLVDREGDPIPTLEEVQANQILAREAIKRIPKILEQGGFIRPEITKLIGDLAPNPAISYGVIDNLQRMMRRAAVIDLATILPELEDLDEESTEALTAAALQEQEPKNLISRILWNPVLMDSPETRSILQDLVVSYFSLALEVPIFSLEVTADGVFIKIPENNRCCADFGGSNGIAGILAGFAHGKMWVQGVDGDGNALNEAQNGLLSAEAILSIITEHIMRIDSSPHLSFEIDKKNIVGLLVTECFKHPDPYGILGTVISGLDEHRQKELWKYFKLAPYPVEDHSIIFKREKVTFSDNWEVLKVEPLMDSSN